MRIGCDHQPREEETLDRPDDSTIPYHRETLWIAITIIDLSGLASSAAAAAPATPVTEALDDVYTSPTLADGY